MTVEDGDHAVSTSAQYVVSVMDEYDRKYDVLDQLEGIFVRKTTADEAIAIKPVV